MSLELYAPGIEADLLLAQWWAQMQAADELTLVFHEAPSLSRFFKAMQDPVQLVVDRDEEGIWFAVWFEPYFSGAFLGTWIRKDKRGSFEALGAFRVVTQGGLDKYPVLLTITKQPHVLPILKRLGYKDFGSLPDFFGGEEAWVQVKVREREKEYGSVSRGRKVTEQG